MTWLLDVVSIKSLVCREEWVLLDLLVVLLSSDVLELVDVLMASFGKPLGIMGPLVATECVGVEKFTGGIDSCGDLRSSRFFTIND